MKRTFQGTVWRYRDLRIAAPARALSVLGDELALVALMLRVHDAGGGARGITLLLLAAALPTVLLAPWSGRAADRFDSRLLTVGSGLAQTAVCAALAWAPGGWLTYALVVTLQGCNAVAGPTWGALLPRIVDRPDIGRALAATQGLTTFAAVGGPAIGGALTGLGGAQLALLVDAGTFLALAAAGAAVRTRRGGATPDASRARALDGIRIVRADVLLWPVFLSLLAYVLVGEATNVAEVFLVRDTLDGTATQYGLVGMAIGAGIFVGSLLGGRVRGIVGLVRAVVLSAVAQALVLTLAGLAPTVLTFAAGWAALGLANGILNTSLMTLTLTRVPDAARGQVLAALSGMSRGCSLGALGLGGLALSLIGPRPVFICSGVLALLVSSWLTHRVRHVESICRPRQERTRHANSART